MPCCRHPTANQRHDDRRTPQNKVLHSVSAPPQPLLSFRLKCVHSRWHQASAGYPVRMLDAAHAVQLTRPTYIPCCHAAHIPHNKEAPCTRGQLQHPSQPDTVTHPPTHRANTPRPGALSAAVPCALRVPVPSNTGCDDQPPCCKTTSVQPVLPPMGLALWSCRWKQAPP